MYRFLADVETFPWFNLNIFLFEQIFRCNFRLMRYNVAHVNVPLLLTYTVHLTIYTLVFHLLHSFR